MYVLIDWPGESQIDWDSIISRSAVDDNDMGEEEISFLVLISSFKF